MLITSNMDRPDYVGQHSREGTGAERPESKRQSVSTSVSTGTYSREALHCDTKWCIYNSGACYNSISMVP